MLIGYEWNDGIAMGDVAQRLERVRRLHHVLELDDWVRAHSDFYRLIALRAADVVQMDVAHCGGILASKKIAAMAAAQDLVIAPHCSVGPVAFAALGGAGGPGLVPSVAFKLAEAWGKSFDEAVLQLCLNEKRVFE